MKVVHMDTGWMVTGWGCSHGHWLDGDWMVEGGSRYGMGLVRWYMMCGCQLRGCSSQ